MRQRLVTEERVDGVVPTIAFKRLVQPLLGKMLQPTQGSPDEILVHYLKAGHVGWGRLDLPEELPKMWATETDISMLHPKVGDLLICEGGEVGRATVIGKPLPPTAIIQNSLHLVRQSQSADVRYLRYALEHAALSGWLDILCNKATIAHLTGDKLRDLQIPFHAASEQTRIANFLDEQTARIDALIAEKERLDGLLGEYRASLISAAVTGQFEVATGDVFPGAYEGGCGTTKAVFGRKLPPNWRQMRLRHIARFISGGTPSKSNSMFWQGQIPWFSPKDFSSGVLADSEDHISAEAVEASATTMLPAGTPVFVVRSGILRHTIPIALLDVDGCINQDVKGVLLKDELIPRYFVYVVQGFQGELIDEWTKQGATVESIEQQFVDNTCFPVPSRQDQTRIASFLDEKTARIDDLRSHCKEHISLLREYRASLVSAAVTGQLDIDSFKRGAA